MALMGAMGFGNNSARSTHAVRGVAYGTAHVLTSHRWYALETPVANVRRYAGPLPGEGLAVRSAPCGGPWPLATAFHRRAAHATGGHLPNCHIRLWTPLSTIPPPFHSTDEGSCQRRHVPGPRPALEGPRSSPPPLCRSGRRAVSQRLLFASNAPPTAAAALQTAVPTTTNRFGNHQSNGLFSSAPPPPPRSPGPALHSAPNFRKLCLDRQAVHAYKAWGALPKAHWGQGIRPTGPHTSTVLPKRLCVSLRHFDSSFLRIALWVFCCRAFGAFEVWTALWVMSSLCGTSVVCVSASACRPGL